MYSLDSYFFFSSSCDYPKFPNQTLCSWCLAKRIHVVIFPQLISSVFGSTVFIVWLNNILYKDNWKKESSFTYVR